MECRANILIVDDNREIREVIHIMLQREGYKVFEAESGFEAINISKETNIDLFILDIMMPLMSGVDACKEIRKFSQAPVLFLTAKSHETDKSEAYQSGGDDYLVKPFSKAELLMKVTSLLRRYFIYKGKADTKAEKNTIQISNIEIDAIKHTVKKDGISVTLTDKEFSILYFLVTNRGEIFNAQQIYESVWNEKYLPASNNTIMVHILNLRKKLEEDPNNPRLITTVWGKGYEID